MKDIGRGYIECGVERRLLIVRAEVRKGSLLEDTKEESIVANAGKGLSGDDLDHQQWGNQHGHSQCMVERGERVINNLSLTPSIVDLRYVTACAESTFEKIDMTSEIREKFL